MAQITVAAKGQDVYQVTVEEGASRTTHDVTVTAEDIERYAPGVSAEQLVEASFRFLLEREPKESILSQFELSVIERYFSEYPVQIREKLSK